MCNIGTFLLPGTWIKLKAKEQEQRRGGAWSWRSWLGQPRMHRSARVGPEGLRLIN